MRLKVRASLRGRKMAAACGITHSKESNRGGRQEQPQNNVTLKKGITPLAAVHSEILRIAVR